MYHESDILCPLCSAPMVKREGKKVFWACSQFPNTHCKGKRDCRTLEPFGIDGEEPVGLNESGAKMFEIGRREGRSWQESEDMARDWQHREEQDQKY